MLHVNLLAAGKTFESNDYVSFVSAGSPVRDRSYQQIDPFAENVEPMEATSGGC